VLFAKRAIGSNWKPAAKSCLLRSCFEAAIQKNHKSSKPVKPAKSDFFRRSKNPNPNLKILPDAEEIAKLSFGHRLNPVLWQNGGF
jgi:hypothetical protein